MYAAPVYCNPSEQCLQPKAGQCKMIGMYCTREVYKPNGRQRTGRRNWAPDCSLPACLRRCCIGLHACAAVHFAVVRRSRHACGSRLNRGQQTNISYGGSLLGGWGTSSKFQIRYQYILDQFPTIYIVGIYIVYPYMYTICIGTSYPTVSSIYMSVYLCPYIYRIPYIPTI